MDKKMFVLVLAVAMFSGCATMRKTGQDKPENRFATGVLIAIPSFICGAFGVAPCWYAFGVGWAWGMSGALEGCARQDGNPFCI